jgi:MarR family 2-MHQ and catechol resistance regulon transcriptional repressor
MSGVQARRKPPQPPRSGDRTDSQDLFNLLRHAHIFSAVVKEILELKLLREVSPAPLSLSQFHLLKLISLNGQHQVGQIADFLGVSAPAASKNIDKLERLGLASREPCEGDRRAILLTSSRRGRNLVRRYEELKTRRLKPVLGALTTAELRRLSQLLERFSMALIDAEDTGEELCFRCSAYFDDNCPITHIHDDCPYQKVRRTVGDGRTERGPARE